MFAENARALLSNCSSQMKYYTDAELPVKVSLTIAIPIGVLSPQILLAKHVQFVFFFTCIVLASDILNCLN